MEDSKVGYLYNGKFLCDSCSKFYQDESNHLTDVYLSNILPYNQHCHNCGKLIVTGQSSQWPDLFNMPKQSTPAYRKLSVIAREIKRLWNPVYFGAVPYLDAMLSLESISDNYGLDSAESIVLYFLANAGTWRGEDARRIKAELKSILKNAK